MGSVKLAVAKGSFCDLTILHPIRGARDVRVVSLPLLWASCKALQYVLGLSRSANSDIWCRDLLCLMKLLQPMREGGKLLLSLFLSQGGQLLPY